MNFLLLTKSSAFILGPIATVLGFIIDGIYRVCALVGIENLGVCIIIFTIITNILMLPLTIKQQKFTKLNSVMNPELQELQKKYKDKKDQISMQKQQVEMQAIYEKYGASPTSGCLPMLIQLPVMFALYRVIYNIPAYIEAVKNVYLQVATPLQNIFTSPEVIQGYTEFVEMAKSHSMSVEKYDFTQANYIIDLLYKFNRADWTSLQAIFPNLSGVIETTANEVARLNSFLGGISLMEAPGWTPSIAWIIPILAGLSQWFSTKLMSQDQPAADPENAAAQSMKTMNTVMPLMSVFFCITLPSCIGIYWVASSVARIVIQIFVNKHMANVPVEDIVRANVEKMNKKREKQGLTPISANAEIKASQKASELAEKRIAEEKVRQEKLKEAKENGTVTDLNIEKKNPGSIAAKAAMVKDFNERTAKK